MNGSDGQDATLGKLPVDRAKANDADFRTRAAYGLSMSASVYLAMKPLLRLDDFCHGIVGPNGLPDAIEDV
jgi:hypothetical protein